MKKIEKPAVDKKSLMRKTDRLVVPPRLEGKVKNAKLRTRKATDKQIRRPRKKQSK